MTLPLRPRFDARPRFGAGARYLRDDLAGALRRLVPADARVLEVGSGTGDTVGALPNVERHGLDADPEAVAYAAARHPGVRFVAGDAATFRSDTRWDAIVCDRLVHSEPDVQALLTNLAEHLTEDGRVFLSCYNVLWEEALTVGQALGWKTPQARGNWLDENDVENLAALAGLEVVKVERRLLLPLPIPGLGHVVNRLLARAPGLGKASLYALFVLRRRARPRREGVRVSVVVPARNEAGNIDDIVRRTPSMGTGTELIFVEGGSKDDTWARIEAAVAGYRGPLTLSACRQPGKGKGDAVRCGFARATGDLLMILDADMTVPPEDLPRFYEAAVSGLADYVQGTRLVYAMEAGAMRPLNELGNMFFGQAFSLILGQRVKDTLCGTKVVWAKDYARIAAGRGYFGELDPFGDFDLIFGAAKLNLKLFEIPIRYRSRTYGETNISRFRHGLLLLRMSALGATKLRFV